ncbi:hypothetical protein IAD21_04528 [Abditibacteriota bacterium]|nr:hypothetical protein IAD21_04528 [Abditibacteriota bacterium]
MPILKVWANQALKSFGLSLTLLLLLAPGAGAQTEPIARTNLLFNSDFESDVAGTQPQGWATFWSREVGAGEMALDEVNPHAGHRALKVTHRGSKDWSVAQAQNLAVAPGDIFTIRAWLRAENVQNAQLSVVARRGDNEVINWALGSIETSGTHEWKLLSRKFVVPAGCATIQFRLIGDGPGTVWLDDAELFSTGNLNAFSTKGRKLNLSNRFLDVQWSGATFSVTDKRNKQVWRQDAGELIVKDARLTTDARQGKMLSLELWDVANDVDLHASIALAADAPEISVSLTGEGAMPRMVTFPGGFVTGKGTSLVVPLNEGILYPVEDKSVSPMQLVAYGGHGISMPWYGVFERQSGAGAMTILNTPDDARIDITRQEGGDLFVRPQWEASRGEFAYTRKLTLVFFQRGGYVAQAKRYREYARAHGLFKTLVQKRRENPNVDLLVGAANIWNWDADKIALCHEMKALGWSKVLWSGGGKPDDIRAINELGYLSSRYNIFQDVWAPDKPAWAEHLGWPEDLVWLPNGDWMRGWAHHIKNPDGTTTVYDGGVICSSRQLAHAQQRVPAELKTIPYRCRFIDTTTASPWRECYNPAHPLSRSQDRHYKMALLQYFSKDLKLVVGTETGIDPSVPFVDYYEGMLSLGPYRLPDAGRDMLQYKPPTPEFLKFQIGTGYRVPLWELVYHDCTVSQWYWGDYNNKAPEVWPQRDLWNILYGTPPMYMFDKPTWEKDKARFDQSYKAICPLVRRVGYDEMVSHEFLTPDHNVQRTRWKSADNAKPAPEVVVNFGEQPYTLGDGRSVKARNWLVK